MQKIGIIDLGSNTTRLIVMAYEHGHRFKLVDEVSETVRLAEGAGAENTLQPVPMHRAVEALKMFNTFCRCTSVDEVLAVGTSAVREARNQAEFLAALEREAGLTLRILSTEEEAFYGYLGAVNSLAVENGFVFDTGGGSTQVILLRDRRFVRAVSRQAGVVRFSERFIQSDPISKRDLRALREGARTIFADLDWLSRAPGMQLVGVGGTVRTLARIHMKQIGYPLDRLHGYLLPRAGLEAIIEQLTSKNRRERAAIPGLKSDRADVTLAGALIIRQLMHQGGFDEVQVSGQGLREGLFYAHFLAAHDPPLIANLRSFSVLNLARLYDYEEAHVARVVELSRSLFDQLAPLHGYGPWERELLEYGAILHDIGVEVGYYDHHKHSAYLVFNGALLGFSHRELVLIAALVRNHRKGWAGFEEYAAVLMPGDDSRIARLSALLRIAEYLERSKSQVVQAVRVTHGADGVRVDVEADGDATVEIWDARRRTALFERAFGTSITIVGEEL